MQLPLKLRDLFAEESGFVPGLLTCVQCGLCSSPWEGRAEGQGWQGKGLVKLLPQPCSCRAQKEF